MPSITPRLIELPYQPDSVALFERIKNRPGAVFLDSCTDSRISSDTPDLLKQEQNTLDLMAATPTSVLTAQLDKNQVCLNGKEIALSPFDALASLMQHHRVNPDDFPSHLPAGMAIALLSYDLGKTLERLPRLNEKDFEFPELLVACYPWLLANDHAQSKTWLIVTSGEINCDELAATFLGDPANEPAEKSFKLKSKFTPNLTAAEYAAKFQHIQELIAAGDCYQVNFAQRFKNQYEGSSWEAYRRLRSSHPTPYSAYYETPYGTLLSHSPEQFLALQNQDVTTRPIKGTRARHHDDAQRDRNSAKSLLASPKDRAENLMIVDLLRNDLGKICETGSIHVDELFGLESFANVHHLVSTVKGKLRGDKNAVDLLQACFPGGSITGAPKVRAMEIIESLEPHHRSVYCGSLAWIGFNGNMNSSILIRSLLCQNENIYCWAGGGIVADSRCHDEYQETLDKVMSMLQCLS